MKVCNFDVSVINPFRSVLIGIAPLNKDMTTNTLCSAAASRYNARSDINEFLASVATTFPLLSNSGALSHSQKSQIRIVFP
mmetsp:Transcript_32088/g.28162  ORF Transcript_32088/g.28162 Transcript_32088/m.28162 type:complete len:81 (-) Transcript_32088:19-261(-)